MIFRTDFFINKNSTRRKNLTKLLFITVIFLLFLIFVNSITVNADNSNSPKIEVETKTSALGDTIDVSINIINNPGISGATLTISYGEGISLINATHGTAFSNLTMTKPGKYVNGCNFLWDPQDLNGESISDGEILKLTFSVSEDAVTGTLIPIKVAYNEGGIVNKDLEPVNPGINNGGIIVDSNNNANDISLSDYRLKANTTELVINSNNTVNGANITIAGYDNNGKFIDSILIQKDLSEGINYIYVDDGINCSYAKAFVFSNNYSPLAESSECQINIDKCKIEFLDWNGKTLSIQFVEKGKDAEEPEQPDRDGYVFAGWDSSFTNVKSDISVKATYSTVVYPTIYLTDASAKPGDKNVEVDVNISNNPGLLGMTLTLGYDPEKFTLKNAVNGEAFTNILTLTPSKQLTNGCKFVWDGVDLSSEDIKDGNILKLYFDVSDNVIDGNYPITFSYNSKDIIDKELNNVYVSIKNGLIKVAN